MGESPLVDFTHDDERRKELSAFLNSRRARLRPDDVGLPPSRGRRRTPGLRREELAAIAGMSVNWYTLFETGRNDSISAKAVADVARALQLSVRERQHLAALARVSLEPIDPLAAPPSAGIIAVLDDLHATPAVVWNRRRDALAWNHLFGAIFDYSATSSPWRRNGVWRIFNDPSRRIVWPDWDGAARRACSALRWQFAREPELVIALLDELRSNADFQRHWAADDGVTDWMHEPQLPIVVGRADGEPLRFLQSTLATPESGMHLVQFYTPTDAQTQTALRRMARPAPGREGAAFKTGTVLHPPPD